MRRWHYCEGKLVLFIVQSRAKTASQASGDGGPVVSMFSRYYNSLGSSTDEVSTSHTEKLIWKQLKRGRGLHLSKTKTFLFVLNELKQISRSLRSHNRSQQLLRPRKKMKKESSKTFKNFENFSTNFLLLGPLALAKEDRKRKKCTLWKI